MGERIKLKASDGFELNAYVARPEGRIRGGVVVLQEVWGINHWVRSVADRYAHHGYLAVAPATQDRAELGYESDDYSPAGRTKIPELMAKFDLEAAKLDIAAAVARAKEGGKVGITGFCFGGRLSWVAASEGLGLSAASGYYGGGVEGYMNLAPKIPTEMHYGEHDHGIPVEQVEKLRAKYPEVGIYLYDADHGFCNSERTPTFNEAACLKASARTLEFFGKHLAS